MGKKAKEISPNAMFETMSTTDNSLTIIDRCPECGGVKYGSLPTPNDHYCFCPNFELKGWICPVCGAGLNPLVHKCPCNEPFIFTHGSDSTY